MSSKVMQPLSWPSACPPDRCRTESQGRYIDVGDSCNAMSLSPDHSHVAVGGRHVLKILSIVDERFGAAIQNLRTGRVNMTFSSNDVEWSPLMPSLIATAATNGKVVIWDIGKSGGSRQSRVLSDHTRAVNRISWHSSDPLLLSGSQDGSVKLWDIRCSDACRQTVDGHFGAVRDVQWSPFNTNIFVSGLDNGSVQVWDLRSTRNLRREITGHQGPVLGVDWHREEPNIVASAGRDRQVKIWDLHSEEFVPRHVISTNASVSRIAWRTGFPSHIASSSTLFDSRLHIWDIHNPYIPIASCAAHDDVVTGFEWLRKGDAVASCSKDSHIAITPISAASCLYEHVPMMSVDWDVDDGFAIFVNGLDRDEACARRFVSIPFHGVDNLKPDKRNGTALGFVKARSEDLRRSYLDPLASQQQFVFLANHYQLSGSPFEALCEHNAAVATDAGRLDMADVWRMLSLLYAPIEFVDPVKRRQSSELYDVGSMFELVPPDDISMRSLLESLPNVKRSGSLPHKDIREATIQDLLLKLADDGDVQNCCAIIIVLGHRLHSEPMFIRRCLVSYIELLHRHQLWAVAVDLIRCSPDESVALMNQNDTALFVVCSNCSEILPSGQASCPSCQRFSSCSLCRGRVLGQFIWCQGCGHGGHPDHIRDWFRDNVQCPAGCLHQCRPMRPRAWNP